MADMNEYLDQEHYKPNICRYCETPLLHDEECECDEARIDALEAENTALKAELDRAYSEMARIQEEADDLHGRLVAADEGRLLALEEADRLRSVLADIASNDGVARHIASRASAALGES